jgi:T4 RnlA family RNA ligase
MYFLPTYQECREICDANDNFTFFETKHCIDGYKISIFSYRLAMPTIFTNPIASKPEIKAHEMRGLTFVWNEDGSLYQRYLLMDKFFNLNQSECSAYSLLKDEKIKEITYKEDGSILSFIKLPNGRIIAKTKASFEADQAIRAQALYEGNTSINIFVNYCLNNNIVPIFEFVSPMNRIVLRYDKTDLVIIKLRDNLTGKYISINDLPKSVVDGNTLVKTFDNLSLDDLITKCEVDKDYEGYVVTFESGKMIKLKLLDYIALHNLHTEDLHREDAIISLIIEEKIDDILAQLVEGDERRVMILELIDLVNHHIMRECHEIKALYEKFDGNRKDFALTYRKDVHFASVMRILNQNMEIVDIVKAKVLHDTFYLMNARKWIEEKKLLLTK